MRQRRKPATEVRAFDGYSQKEGKVDKEAGNLKRDCCVVK